MNIVSGLKVVSGRRAAQKRVAGGRWRRIVLGDGLAEHVLARTKREVGRPPDSGPPSQRFEFQIILFCCCVIKYPIFSHLGVCVLLTRKYAVAACAGEVKIIPVIYVCTYTRPVTALDARAQTRYRNP